MNLKICLTLIKNHTQLIYYQFIYFRELHSQIEKLKFELKNLNEVFAKTESTSSQASAVQAGFAYSSPTSSFSDQSDKSWNDLSNISIEDASQEEDMLKKDTPVRDSEFVSLLDGESSHTIMPEQSQGKCI